MKTLLLFAIQVALSPCALSGPLEGSLAIRAQVLEAIEWHDKQCTGSAFKSAAMARDNSDDSDEMIQANLLERLAECDAISARREARLNAGALNAVNLAPGKTGHLDLSLALALLDRND